MPQDKLELLYNDIKNEYDVGSLDDFRAYLSDDKKRQAFFTDVVQPTYDVKSIDEFENTYGLKKKSQEVPSGVPSAPTAKSSLSPFISAPQSEEEPLNLLQQQQQRNPQKPIPTFNGQLPKIDTGDNAEAVVNEKLLTQQVKGIKEATKDKFIYPDDNLKRLTSDEINEGLRQINAPAFVGQQPSPEKPETENYQIELGNIYRDSETLRKDIDIYRERGDAEGEQMAIDRYNATIGAAKELVKKYPNAIKIIQAQQDYQKEADQFYSGAGGNLLEAGASFINGLYDGVGKIVAFAPRTAANITGVEDGLSTAAADAVDDFFKAPFITSSTKFQDGDKLNWNKLLPAVGQQAGNMGALLLGGEVLGGGGTGLFASSYMTTRNDYYDAARAKGFSQGEANAISDVSAGLTSVLELISPNTAAFAPTWKADMLEEYTKQLAKSPKNAVSNTITSLFEKEIIPENVQELSQLLGDKLVETGADYITGEDKFNPQINLNDVISTVALTTLTTGLVSGTGVMAENKQARSQAIYELAKQPEKTQQILQDQVNQGIITPQQAESVFKVVAENAEAQAKIPDTVPEDSKVEATELVSEKQRIKAEIEGKDEILSAPQKERIKQIDEELKSIVTPKTEELSTENEIQKTETAQTSIPTESGIGLQQRLGEDKPTPVVEAVVEPIATGEEVSQVEAIKAEQQKELDAKVNRTITNDLIETVLPEFGYNPSDYLKKDGDYDTEKISTVFDSIESQINAKYDVKLKDLGQPQEEVSQPVVTAESETEAPQSVKVEQPTVSETPSASDVDSTAKALDGIESFETAKGSIYTVLPNGKTQRFKTATKEQNEPNDLIVFAKFENAQQEQDFLSAQNRQDGKKLYVVDSAGNVYDTNEQVKGKDVRLAIIKDGKAIETVETSLEPKIGYNTFDQRRYEEKGEKYRSTHLGNKVTKITPKAAESPLSKEQTLQDNGKNEAERREKGRQDVLTSQTEDTGGEKPPVVESSPKGKTELTVDDMVEVGVFTSAEKFDIASGYVQVPYDDKVNLTAKQLTKGLQDIKDGKSNKVTQAINRFVDSVNKKGFVTIVRGSGNELYTSKVDVPVSVYLNGLNETEVNKRSDEEVQTIISQSEAFNDWMDSLTDEEVERLYTESELSGIEALINLQNESTNNTAEAGTTKESSVTTPIKEEPTKEGLTPEEKANLESVAEQAGVNFREVQNVYNKYGGDKPLSEITTKDYQKAQEKRDKAKVEERKQKAEKKIDDAAAWLKDKLKIDLPEGTQKMGFTQDDLIDLVARAAKVLVKTGITAHEAVRQVLASLKEGGFIEDTEQVFEQARQAVIRGGDFIPQAGEQLTPTELYNQYLKLYDLASEDFTPTELAAEVFDKPQPFEREMAKTALRNKKAGENITYSQFKNKFLGIRGTFFNNADYETLKDIVPEEMLYYIPAGTFNTAKEWAEQLINDYGFDAAYAAALKQAERGLINVSPEGTRPQSMLALLSTLQNYSEDRAAYARKEGNTEAEKAWADINQNLIFIDLAIRTQLGEGLNALKINLENRNWGELQYINSFTMANRKVEAELRDLIGKVNRVVKESAEAVAQDFEKNGSTKATANKTTEKKEIRKRLDQRAEKIKTLLRKSMGGLNSGIPAETTEVFKEIVLYAVDYIKLKAPSFKQFKKHLVETFGFEEDKIDDKDLRSKIYNPARSASDPEFAVKVGVEDFNKFISDIIRSHYSKTTNTAGQLAKEIQAKTGISESESNQLAKEIEKAITDLGEVKKKQIIKQKLFQNSIKNAQIPQSQLEKMIELSNFGALDEEQSLDLFKEKFKLKEASKETIDKIRELSKQVRDEKGEQEQARLVQELADYVKNQSTKNGVLEYLLANFYSNIFLSIGSNVANATWNMMQIGKEGLKAAGLSIIQDIKGGKGLYTKEVAKATARATNAAVKNFVEVISTGVPSYKGMENISSRNIWERIKLAKPTKGDKWNIRAAYGFKAAFLGWQRLAGRLLLSMDALSSAYVHEMAYAAMTIQDINSQNLTPSERKEAFMVAMSGTPTEREAYKDEANAIYNTSESAINGILALSGIKKGDEGYAEAFEKQFNKRKKIQKEYFTQQLESAKNPQVQQRAKERTAELLLYQTPPTNTAIGYLAAKLNEVSNQSPAIRFLVPVVNTVANLSQMAFDYTVFGLAYVPIRKSIDRYKTPDQVLSPEQTKKRLQRAAIGTGISVLAFVAAAMSADDDEDEGWFDVIGDIPAEPGAREAFYREGKMPYSLKFGDKYVSYKNSPFVFAFATAGKMRDYQKRGKELGYKTKEIISEKLFRKSYGDLTKEEAATVDMKAGQADIFKSPTNFDRMIRWGQASLEAPISMASDFSMLSGVTGLYEAIVDDKSGGKQVQKWAANMTTRLIPVAGSGIVSEMNQAIDPRFRRPDNMWEMMKVSTGISDNDVPLKYDIFGRETARYTKDINASLKDKALRGAGYIVGRRLGNTAPNDPVDKFFDEHNIIIDPATNNYGFTEEYFGQFQKESGEWFYEYVSDNLKTFENSGLTDDQLQSYLRDVNSKIRSNVKKTFVEDALFR